MTMTAEQFAAIKSRETPFTHDDDRFEGKEMVSIKVGLTLRTDLLGETQTFLWAKPTTPGQSEIICIDLKNYRLEAFLNGKLRDYLEYCYMMDGCDADLDEVRLDVTFDGFWTGLEIGTCGDGEIKNFKHFVAARWTFECEGEKHVEGALPGDDSIPTITSQEVPEPLTPETAPAEQVTIEQALPVVIEWLSTTSAAEALSDDLALGMAMEDLIKKGLTRLNKRLS